MDNLKKSSLAVILILLLSNLLAGFPSEEPTLQEWFIDNAYAIDVASDETGIEIFPVGNYRVILLDEFAAYAAENTFGWYSLKTGKYYELFSGEDSANSTIEFSTTEPFGLYLGSPNGTFHTEIGRNEDNFDHAWIFQDPRIEEGHIVAWEDLWGGGDKDFQDIIVSIQALRAPHSAFTWSPLTPQTGETVVFNASASTPDGGNIIEYEWNFGDGNITQTSNPIITHIYLNFGNYTVRLKVTDDEGKSDTVSHIIRVRGHPQATFTYYPPTPQVNEEITFNASESTPDGGTLISYKWNFGDDTSAEGVIVIHKYTQPGSYLVVLNITDSEGKWDITSKLIEIQEPQPEPSFAVKIEKALTSPDDPYKFQTPAYSKTFEVEVWIQDVSNMFKYEFSLHFDPAIVQLIEHEVKHVHSEDSVILEEVDNITGTYKQSVTAQEQAEPYQGSTALVILRFQIIDDPCYPYNYTSILQLSNTKIFDPNDIPIEHWKKDGYFTIFSVKPKISITSQGETEITKWIVNETFTVDITLTDVVKMKGYFLELEYCNGLETNHQKIEVTYFLPPPYVSYRVTIYDTTLTVQVEMPSEKLGVNGNGTILRITFKVKNPWGDIPPYRLIGDQYLPENYTCKIRLIRGWIDVYCPEYRKMEFYNCAHGVEVENEFTYTFTPVPGDLNLDGQVDTIDLSAISQWVGYTSEDPEWAECKGFDLNNDGSVDLTDAIIVAANFGRNEP